MHHDEALALIAMELLEPHIIMRKGLVSGISYPRFVDHITTFLARTLFLSSDLAVPAAEKKQGIAAFSGNHALCKITEDLIFTEPYFQAEQNRWTSPWLDATAAAFREDLDLHVAISRLKLKFMGSPEALIHGDLHTGSIMVTESETLVIDPEFAFYGPMGFDVGAVLGNLIMGYLASSGHERSPGERRAFEAWMLETIENVWLEFSRKFHSLARTVSDADLANMRGLDRLHMDIQFASSRMLRGRLSAEGCLNGRRHVRTLMRRMGIEALYRRAGTTGPEPGHMFYAYLLCSLEIMRPNEVWAMDITYVPTARELVYLGVVLD